MQFGFTLSGFTRSNSLSFLSSRRLLLFTSRRDLVELLSSALDNSLSVLSRLAFVFEDGDGIGNGLFTSFPCALSDRGVEVRNGVLESDGESVELSLGTRAGVQVGVLYQRGHVGGSILLEGD